jgi:leucyl aminopeptidase
MINSLIADINNDSQGKVGASLGATFLGDFISLQEWAHLDM